MWYSWRYMFGIFHTIFYIPLYNALIFLTQLFGGSLGLGVIGLTILVKLILAPLSHKSIVSQIAQKKLQPLIEELKNKYPDKKEQSQKLLELYKEHKTNPFAGCLLIILQLPVIIALYQVFLHGGVANPAELWSFISVPETVHTMFLGLDMGQGGVMSKVILAGLAGISQYLQMKWSPAMQNTPVAHPGKDDAQANMMASMTRSMKYTMPAMIVVFAYAVPGAVALYWIISNIFMIAQERMIAKKYIK